MIPACTQKNPLFHLEACVEDGAELEGFTLLGKYCLLTIVFNGHVHSNGGTQLIGVFIDNEAWMLWWKLISIQYRAWY